LATPERPTNTKAEGPLAQLAAWEHAVWEHYGGGPVVRQSVRFVLSIALAWLAAHIAHLREPVWSLITAVIVTQGSITQTMSTGRDQIIGTLIGAGTGIAVIGLGLWVMPGWLAFDLALIPLVWLAAWRGTRRFALITLMVIVLFPSEGGPFTRPLDRLLSILCGVGASVVVSYVVLHRPARREAFATAASLLDIVADMITKALDRTADHAQLVAMVESGIEQLFKIDALLTEAARERRAKLAERDPMLSELPSVMRRIHSDAFLVARAVNAGKELLGPHEITPVRETLVQAVNILRDRCRQEAKHGRPMHATAEIPSDFLDEKSRCVFSTTPEMRFVFALLLDDLHRGGRLLWPDAPDHATNTAPQPA